MFFFFFKGGLEILWQGKLFSIARHAEWYNNPRSGEKDLLIPQTTITFFFLPTFCTPVTFEPRHEKTCFSHMRTTKAQISLHIHAVWSAPLLFAT